MSKRRQRGDNSEDLLSELGSNEVDLSLDNLTASDVANMGYGSQVPQNDPFAKLPSRGEKIQMMDIESISPDLTQPRRAIPSSIRQYWSGQADANSMADFFTNWLDEINLERQANGINTPFPLDEYLQGDKTSRAEGIDKEEALEQIGNEQLAPKEKGFMPIIDLAASIKRDGLINPISVAKQGRAYQIETGERRWLAYHLLNWREGGDEWFKIPARQVDKISIWRQATENNTRADLNAIGKARQFALLLMDILSDNGRQFDSYPDFSHEQDFYAQVEDGNTYRVPRNRGEDLLNAMGLENPVQIRQYRALLRLPQPIWEWADDLNWSESFIRKTILAGANTDEDKIRNAVRQAHAEGYTVSSVTVWEHLLENPKKTKSPKVAKYTYKKFSTGIGEKVYDFVQKMPPKEKTKAIEYLEDMLNALKSE